MKYENTWSCWFVSCIFIGTIWLAGHSCTAESKHGRRDERHAESETAVDTSDTDDDSWAGDDQPVFQTGRTRIDIRMPAVRTKTEDEYLCYAWQVPVGEFYIVNYKPLADASNVHHILLFGCQTAILGKHWSGCSPCRSGESIMYAWAQNAPPLELPKDVGFRIGNGTNVQYIVIQVHYRRPTKAEEPNDSSGVELTITTEWQKYVGGIYLLIGQGVTIHAHDPKVYSDAACKYDADAVIYPFAFRTHAHVLGKVITGYHINDTWHLLAKGNPQWPQAFYPVKNKIILKRGDKMVARCTYNASSKSVDTYMGSTHNDEMCNLYVMYYTANGASSYYLCVGLMEPDLISHIPADADVALPPNPLLDEIAVGHVHRGVQVVPNWPHVLLSDFVNLGQISGIATDAAGHVHIFHRGIRVWDYSMFENDNRFLKVHLGPIPDNTLLELDPVSGKILTQWGANLFYMCHGLTIDNQNNFWVTDVAMHQVMKLRLGSDKPELTLGVKFEPGSDSEHFCKPTDVAVLSTGEFFVADGYCNSRVMKFSGEGKFIMQWGKSSAKYGNKPPGGAFDVPHSISVDENRHQVYVADRENGRLQCFDFDGKLTSVWNKDEFAPKLFAITYNNATDQLYAVNGADLSNRAITGSSWNPQTKELVSTWQPKNAAFVTPHDVAVCPSGQNIYVVEIGPNRLWKFHNYDSSSEDEELPIFHPIEYTTISHQSIKKAGVHVSQSSDHDTTDSDDKIKAIGQMDVTTMALTIAALFTVPLVIAVVATLCLRQWRNKVTGYNRLDFTGVYHTRNLQMRGLKPLITQPKEYKDIPDSEESDNEEFNINSVSHRSANNKPENGPATLAT